MSVKAQGDGGLRALADMSAKNVSFLGRLPVERTSNNNVQLKIKSKHKIVLCLGETQKNKAIGSNPLFFTLFYSLEMV